MNEKDIWDFIDYIREAPLNQNEFNNYPMPKNYKYFGDKAEEAEKPEKVTCE